MPTKAYSFGTTEETIAREDNRTVLTIQNIHGANYLYVSDNKGLALSDGIRLSPGGVFSVKKALGEEPEKAYYVVGSAAATTARMFTDYGDYPRVLTDIEQSVSEQTIIHNYPETPPRVSGWG